MTQKSCTILIAAGGTGGHVIPALALADALHARGHKVVFATDNRGIQYVKDRPWMKTHIIHAGTFRKDIIRLIKDIGNMILGIFESFDLVRDYRPDAVAGFGGYPCFPPVFVAQLLRIPTLLHEQNAVIGHANKYLAMMCTRLALSFPDFTGLSTAQRKRTLVTGRPVAAAIEALYDRLYIPPASEGPFEILIMGGSQGAKVVSHAVAHAFAGLPDSLRRRLKLTHQVLKEDLEEVRNLYKSTGITATTTSYIEAGDVARALATAHLFIGRSGASVTEIWIAGLPAIYIPYPHHKDQQQVKNAKVAVDVGGGVILQEKDFTLDKLQTLLIDFMQTPSKLAAMAAAARSCAHPRADQALADAVLSLIKS